MILELFITFLVAWLVFKCLPLALGLCLLGVGLVTILALGLVSFDTFGVIGLIVVIIWLLLIVGKTFASNDS